MLKKPTNLKVYHHQYTHFLHVFAERTQMLAFKHSLLKESELLAEMVDFQACLGQKKFKMSLQLTVMAKDKEMHQKDGR